MQIQTTELRKTHLQADFIIPQPQRESVCVCVCVCVGSVFGFLWPGVGILTADSFPPPPWMKGPPWIHTTLLTLAPQTNPPARSLTPARKPRRRRLWRSEPPHEHMDCVMKMSGLRQRGSSCRFNGLSCNEASGCPGRKWRFRVYVQDILRDTEGCSRKWDEQWSTEIKFQRAETENWILWWLQMRVITPSSYWPNCCFPLTPVSFVLTIDCIFPACFSPWSTTCIYFQLLLIIFQITQGSNFPVFHCLLWILFEIAEM